MYCFIYFAINTLLYTNRVFQRGGGGGGRLDFQPAPGNHSPRGGHWGQFAPGPQFKGPPKFAKTKKIILNIFDIKMRKNFLNQNFTFIDRKKGFDP